MKPITKVFIIIGALLLCLLVWSAVFNDGGLMRVAWNTMANTVNSQVQKVTGDSDTTLIPEWAGDDGHTLEDGGSW